MTAERDSDSRRRHCLVLAASFAGAALAVMIVRAGADGALGDWFDGIALTELPLAERHLVEFLLLLPVAALVICFYRNIIGLVSFGTFAPALVGLCFRERSSLPGMSVFLGLLLAGWLIRRRLDRLHLLQAPRASIVLSLVVAMLVVFVAVASRWHVAVTKYVSLFPVIILAGMIERFWLLEADGGVSASFKTLLGTLVIAVSVALVTGMPWLSRWLMRYPEAIGFAMAGQVLLGRFTGYRVSELWRFRHLAGRTPVSPPEPPLVYAGTARWRRI